MGDLTAHSFKCVQIVNLRLYVVLLIEVFILKKNFIFHCEYTHNTFSSKKNRGVLVHVELTTVPPRGRIRTGNLNPDLLIARLTLTKQSSGVNDKNTAQVLIELF